MQPRATRDREMNTLCIAEELSQATSTSLDARFEESLFSSGENEENPSTAIAELERFLSLSYDETLAISK